MILAQSSWSQAPREDVDEYMHLLLDRLEKELYVETDEEMLLAIPNLKEMARYSNEIKADYYWATANIYISYCFLLNKEMDSLKYYSGLVEERITELQLTPTHRITIESDAAFMLGKYYYAKGLFDQAAYYYQWSINVLLEAAGKDGKGVINYSKVGIHFSMNPSNLFNDMALIYEKFGDYDNAIRYYDIAMKISNESEYDYTRTSRNARKLSNLSFALLRKGRMDEAHRMIRMTEQILSKFDNEFSDEVLGLVYRSAAYYYHLNQQQDSCLYYINKGVNLDTKDEFKIKIYHVYLDALDAQAEDSEIESVIDSIGTIAGRSIGYFHPDMAISYWYKGNVYDKKDKGLQAQRDYDTALNILLNKKQDECNCKDLDISELVDKRLAMEILYSKAMSFRTQGQLEKGMDCFDRIHELIIELQNKYIQHEESKYFLAQRVKEIYEYAIYSAVEMNDAEKAYLFAQSSKGMVLLQQLNTRNAMSDLGLPNELLQKGLRITQNINELEKRKFELLLDGNKKSVDSLEARIFSLNQNYKLWEENLVSNYPTYYQMKFLTLDLDIRGMKRKLKKDNAVLLEYFLGKKNIFRFFLDGDKLTVSKEEIGADFEDRIYSLQEHISQNQYDVPSFLSFAQLSYEISKVLLYEEVMQGGGVGKNMYVVPDGILNLIPFEVLLTQPFSKEVESPKYGSLDYLVRDYNISYLYSSQLLTQKMINQKGNKFLGVAPEFDDDRIQALNYNIPEVEKINELYQGELLLGKDATYKNFIASLKNVNIAHLATHAIFNDELPLDSRIELADTSLYIFEIFNLEHQLQLVVMSACQTATGKRRKGEGVVSLSRAFIQSGCSSVVASLWDVSDDKAGYLMHRFHDDMKQNHQKKNIALSESKRKFINESVNRNLHPYNWAGFILVGNTSPLQSPHNGHYFYYLLVILSIVYLLITMRRKMRKGST